jgi:hypothetical protein
VPQKNPQLALDNYLYSLMRSLACGFAYTSARLGVCSVLTLSAPTASLRSGTGEDLFLSFQQDFKIQNAGKGFQVTTLSYRYGLEDGKHDEILLYHWHPKSRVATPHLHIPCVGRVHPELGKAHLPTLRVSFEDFLLCLVTEFNIEASKNYAVILTENRRAFRDRSSWIYWD